MANYKAQGLNAVTPYLTIDGADRLIEFLQAAFGAELLERHEDGDRVAHAKMRLDDSIIELSDATERYTARPATLHFYVPDIDATYAAAMAAGATSLSEPADMDYGERSAGVEDPAGNYWYLATAK